MSPPSLSSTKLHSVGRASSLSSGWGEAPTSASAHELSLPSPSPALGYFLIIVHLFPFFFFFYGVARKYLLAEFAQKLKKKKKLNFLSLFKVVWSLPGLWEGPSPGMQPWDGSRQGLGSCLPLFPREKLDFSFLHPSWRGCAREQRDLG